MASDRSPGIYITVDKDGWTKALQLSIDCVDADGGGHGYRLAGPKYNGSSAPVMRHRLGARDIEEIQRYLDRAKAALAV
jgi:hypothetical protein